MATTHNILVKGKALSSQLDAYLKNVQHPTSDLDNGNVVILTGLTTSENDLWIASTPADVTAQEVFIMDTPVRVLVDGKYAIDVQDPREFYLPATKPGRARKLAIGDTCYLSAAGFSSTPTVGQYAIPANGSFELAPAANLAGATKVAFKVIATHNFYVGTTTVTGYRLECVAAVA